LDGKAGNKAEQTQSCDDAEEIKAWMKMAISEEGKVAK